MKKLYTLLLLIVITTTITHSKNFNGRIMLDDNGFIAVQFRNISGVNLPDTFTLITNSESDIRYLKALQNGKLSDIKMTCHDSGYPFEIKQGSNWPKVNRDLQFCKTYITGSFYSPYNWIVNEWVTEFHYDPF